MRTRRWSRFLPLLACPLLMLLAAAASADPPLRVARLSYIGGAVSFSPGADADAWVQARLNRPLITGDRIWTDAGARTELELGTVVLRAAPQTSLNILDINDQIAQFEVAQGRINVRVRALGRGETVEVDTPNLAFVITAPGHYQIDVDAGGDATVVAVRDGRAEAYGERTSYVIAAGQSYRFYGVDLDNDYAPVPPPDEFDRWTFAREARRDHAVSVRYVSPEMIGYEDLDAYGTWTTVAEYGAVWIPRAVPADWAPYRNGHWAWIDPWGWTWVDDAPWGFAPFHYGRWARVNARWGWVPGPHDVRPVYAPALVAFVGGAGFGATVRSEPARVVGWFPLGPGEVYRPAYQVSREYFTRVNVTNTRVDVNYVSNVYNNAGAERDLRYRNRQAADAITVVPMQALMNAQPVARAAVRMDPQAMQRVQQAPVAAAPPAVAPATRSLVGAAPAAQARPPVAAVQRQTMARSAPPAAPPAFTPHDPGAVASPPVARRALASTDHVRVVGGTTPPPVAQPAPSAQRRAPNGTASTPSATAPPAAARPATPGQQPPTAVPPAASRTATPGQQPPTAVPPAAARTATPGQQPPTAVPPAAVARPGVPTPPEAAAAGRAGESRADRARPTGPAPGATPSASAPAAAPAPPASAQGTPSKPSPVPPSATRAPAPSPAPAASSPSAVPEGRVPPGLERSRGAEARREGQGAPTGVPPAAAVPPTPPRTSVPETSDRGDGERARRERPNGPPPGTAAPAPATEPPKPPAARAAPPAAEVQRAVPPAPAESRAPRQVQPATVPTPQPAPATPAPPAAVRPPQPATPPAVARPPQPATPPAVVPAPTAPAPPAASRAPGPPPAAKGPPPGKAPEAKGENRGKGEDKGDGKGPDDRERPPGQQR